MAIVRALLLAMVFVFAVLPSPASATAFTTNYSDLWWNSDKSGWGLNITMQSNVMFATWFVYGPDNKPIWYSATLEYAGATAIGEIIFAGDLYQTNGPWFGGPFNPALVQYRRVGTASFTTQYVDSATLRYSVDGVNVVEPIRRQTLRNNDMSGNYIGGTSDVSFNCALPSNNNQHSDDVGYFTVTQVGTSVVIRTDSCTLSGTYGQQGQIGAVVGTFSCLNGISGSMTMFDIRVETSGLVGRYTGRNQQCSYDGNFGGIRRK